MPPSDYPDWLFPSAVLRSRGSNQLRCLWVESITCRNNDIQVVVRAIDFGQNPFSTMREASTVDPTPIQTTAREIMAYCEPLYFPWSTPDSRDESIFVLNPRRAPLSRRPISHPTLRAWVEGRWPPPEPDYSPGGLTRGPTLHDWAEAPLSAQPRPPMLIPPGGVFTERPITGFTEQVRLEMDGVLNMTVPADTFNNAVESLPVNIQGLSTHEVPTPPETNDLEIPLLPLPSLLGAIEARSTQIISPPRPSSIGGTVVMIRHTGPGPYILFDRRALNMPPLHLGHDAEMTVRIPPPEQMRTPTPEDLYAMRELLDQVADDPDYSVVLSGQPQVEYQGPVTPGSVMVLRSDPQVRFGLVLALTQEWRDGHTHDMVRVLMDAEGVEQRTLDIPLDALLEQTRPVPAHLAPRAGISPLDRLDYDMRKQVNPDEPPKPRLTIYERLLKDDD